MATGDIDPDAIIQLVSNEGKIFDVEIGAIQLSTTLKDMLEACGFDPDSPDEAPVPIPNVNSAILQKVIEWCRHHRDSPPEEDEDANDGRQKPAHVDKWDQEFLTVNQGTLLGLMLAANYLDIRGLMTATTKTVANMLRGLSVEEIRDKFGIVNDFTAEEEEEIRKQNDWCEDT